MKKSVILFAALAVFCFNGLSAQEQPKVTVGLLDLEAIVGINWTQPKKNLSAEGYFGTDYDLGVTFLSVPLGKSDPSPAATVALHYDYSRQNFDSFQVTNEVKFRRHEVYARLKPFTFHPSYYSEYNRVMGLVLAGLYADAGYTSGNYFYEDVYDTTTTPNDKKNGMFWGWGWNLNFKKGRTGGIVGYGSKIYSFDDSLGNAVKYSSRSFHFGVSYALDWREK